MKHILSGLLLCGCVAACRQSAPLAAINGQSPRQRFPGLFEAVQEQRLFADSKTFTDARPLRSPGSILADWQQQRERTGFDPAAFIKSNFDLPAPVVQRTYTRTEMTAHIKQLWPALTRKADTAAQYSSLIPLPQPYVVPGGRFREVYYWDSYFTMLGLAASGQWPLVRSMTDNFRYLIDTYGFIPNGNRTYYLSRSQPPYFSQMVTLLLQEPGADSIQVFKKYAPALAREYAFWMDRHTATPVHCVRMPDGAVLNRYYDRGKGPREESWNEDKTTAANAASPEAIYHELRSGAESGWDYSSRWFSNGKDLRTIQVTGKIPVDLNCLLWQLEHTLAAAYRLLGDGPTSRDMLRAAGLRAAAIQRYCWSREQGWFFDYDITEGRQSVSLHLAGAYPLYTGMVRSGQADSMARVIRSVFLRPGGLVTTTQQTGQQWDAPNGWAPLQWTVITGLQHYGYTDLAYTIAGRWYRLNRKVFLSTGKMMEKYNVCDTTLAGGGGEYPNQDGFGWTNGVLLNLQRQLPPGVTGN